MTYDFDTYHKQQKEESWHYRLWCWWYARLPVRIWNLFWSWVDWWRDYGFEWCPKAWWESLWLEVNWWWRGID